MTTFKDISKDYANRLRAAFQADGFTKSASLNERAVRESSTARVLKEIAAELEEKWTSNGQPLTDDQKKIISEGIGDEFGLPDTTTVFPAIKSSSNDSYMELVTHIGQILKDKK